MTTTSTLDPVNARVKAMWSAGDFGRIARSYERGAADFIARIGIRAGERVLDVACGSGNLTLPTARAGARVIGVDIAPNLVAQARARAAAEGLDIQIDEGDCEALPYPDDSFDTVTSMFGAMFAPHPERAAAEMVRVCRPGGRIAMANWTAAGFAGQMFKVVATHVPPPPDVPPPLLWGDEATVRERFKNAAADIKLTRHLIDLEYPFPPAEVVEHFRLYFGPTVNAFAALDAAGQEALRRDLIAHWSKHNHAPGAATHVQSEYLEVLITRR